MGQIIDISQPLLTGMAVYPGNPSVEITGLREAGGVETALTRITIGSHTGTHIDAPSHVKAGAAGTAAYSLEQLLGPAQVIEITASDVIRAEDIPMQVGERVVIKTRNSAQDAAIFDETFVALDEGAAQALVERGVKLVGIDGPSIKKRGVQNQVHEILLLSGVVILEGLRLAAVSAGEYELLCLPLALDLDGAPARAVLRSA